MKLLTICGTRPEFIRLSKIVARLDDSLDPGDHYLLNTGQNFTPELSDVFLDGATQMLRNPDRTLQARGPFHEQIGIISAGVADVIREFQPDRFFVLGDTNSSLGAITAKRMGIPVFHLESGNRCHDPRSPEEVNRKIIDHLTDVHMCYSERSAGNLITEGVPRHRIYTVGNPMWELLEPILEKHSQETWLSLTGAYECERILNQFGHAKSQDFLLMTLHRQETVDDWNLLAKVLHGVERTVEHLRIPCLISTHPRLRQMLDRHAYPPHPGLHFLDPLPWQTWIELTWRATLVLTDSGTVQEEAEMMGLPCVVLRNATERIETVENGNSIVIRPDQAFRIKPAAVSILIPNSGRPGRAVADYRNSHCSQAVTNILLGTHI